MKKLLKKIFIRLLKLGGVLFVLSLLWVVSYKYINPPITGMMLYKWANTENYTIDQQWKKLENIDSSLPTAFIASEDQKFLTHNGFDILAIQQAFKSNKEGTLRGASTISQQVAKNVFLLPTKNFFRKGLEAYFTTLIELVWGKRRIMEVYLNIVELGEGIYGVESACQKNFKKASNTIAREQAALMAVVLPNPLKMKLAVPSEYMKRRKTWVLEQMNNLGGERIVLEWYE